MNFLLKGLEKLVKALDQEEIDYMIVGGFAVNFYNRARFTNDIDFVVKIYPDHIEKIIKHFPDWLSFMDSFKEQAAQGKLFNIMDFETGVKYDFILYQDSDYNWTAFNRRREVDFLGVKCWIAAPEDLIISKLQWYDISKSDKQLGDIIFLLNEVEVDEAYLELWTTKLYINRHGLF